MHDRNNLFTFQTIKCNEQNLLNDQNMSTVEGIIFICGNQIIFCLLGFRILGKFVSIFSIQDILDILDRFLTELEKPLFTLFR